MADLPGTDFEANPIVMIALVVVAVLVVAVLLGGIDLRAVLESEALFPTTLGLFVMAMVVIDWYRRQ